MSSGKEKKLILNHIKKMIDSTKWSIKYAHMTEIYGIPERVYEILFNNKPITLATVDDIDESNKRTHLKKDILFYKLDVNGFIKSTCKLKRKKNS